MQTDRQMDRAPTLQHAALVTVSVAATSRPPLQLPALCLMLGVRVRRVRWMRVVPLRPVPWLLQPDSADAIQPLSAPGVGLHVEEGGHPVVLRHAAAEVDDTTLVRALV